MEKEFYEFVSKFAPIEGDKSTSGDLSYPPLFNFDSTGRFSGSAIVDFQNSNDAHRAIRELDGTPFGSRTLWVSMSHHQRSDRPATGNATGSTDAGVDAGAGLPAGMSGGADMDATVAMNTGAAQEGNLYNTGSEEAAASHGSTVENEEKANETEGQDQDTSHGAFNREESHENEYAYYDEEYNPSHDGKGDAQVEGESSEDKLLYGHAEKKDETVNENVSGESQVPEKEDDKTGVSEQEVPASDATTVEN